MFYYYLEYCKCENSKCVQAGLRHNKNRQQFDFECHIESVGSFINAHSMGRDAKATNSGSKKRKTHFAVSTPFKRGDEYPQVHTSQKKPLKGGGDMKSGSDLVGAPHPQLNIAN